MLKKLLKQNNGFSLMELIVTLAIVSILSVGLLTVLSTTQRASTNIDKAMLTQQHMESIVSLIRANMANAQEVTVMDAPDPSTEMSHTKGEKVTRTLPDTTTISFYDDYTYIVADETNGGIIIYDFDDSGNRISTAVGAIKKLDMNVSSFADVKFGLVVDEYLSVSVQSKLIDKSKPAGSQETNSPDEYSLYTKIATDENVCDKDAASVTGLRCVRFRKTTVNNFTWEDIPTSGGADVITIEAGEQNATINVNLDEGNGVIIITNGKNEDYKWPPQTATFGGKLVETFTCDGADVSFDPTHKAVVLSCKSGAEVPRSDDPIFIPFTFTLSTETGVQEVGEVKDKGDGTGYIKVTNTKEEDYVWAGVSVNFSSPIDSFTLSNPEGTTTVASFTPGDTTVTVSGKTAPGDGQVEIGFTYTKAETNIPFNAKFQKTDESSGEYGGNTGKFIDGFIIVENPNEMTKKLPWECPIGFPGYSTPVVVSEETDSNCCVLDYSNPENITSVELELDGLSATASVEDSSKKYIKIRFFVKEIVNPPTFKCVSCAQKGSTTNCFRLQVNVTNNHPSKWLTSVRVKITLPDGSKVEDVYCDNRDSNGNLYANETTTPKGKAYGVNFDPAVGPGATSKGTSDSGDYFNYNGGAAYTHFGCNVGYINTTSPSTTGTVSGTSNQAGKVKIEIIGDPIYEDTQPVRY